MVGNVVPPGSGRVGRIHAHQPFGDIERQRGYARGRDGVVAVLQQMDVVLDGCAAARCIDQDGVQALAVDFRDPGPHVGLGEFSGLLAVAHVQIQRAAAGRRGRYDHFATQARQQAYRRVVDVRREHGLHATRQQGDAPLPFAAGG